MILVMLLQHLLSDRTRRNAAGSDRVQDLPGVDRVKVVEAFNRVHTGVGHAGL